MKILRFFKSGVALIMAAAAVSCATEEKCPFPVPEKPILEMDYTAERTTFEVWAPTAESAVVKLYDGDTLAEEIAMERTEDGLWMAVAEGDHKGQYYAFQLTIDGKPLKETAGIFARALDVNGNRGAIIEALVSQVEAGNAQTVINYRAKLEAKLREVLASTTIDESRILTEAAIFADKVAVDEETVRLRSHLQQMYSMLSAGGAVGRKLDFLLQEMNREANTIGSKCTDVALARIVVDIKAELEKIREQTQNME